MTQNFTVLNFESLKQFLEEAGPTQEEIKAAWEFFSEQPNGFITRELDNKLYRHIVPTWKTTIPQYGFITQKTDDEGKVS